MRRETKTWAGRIVAAGLVSFALAYIPYHVYARSGLARTLALRRDLAALRAHNRDLGAENDRLAREAEALRSDPAAIERVARADLGWVRPGELVIELAHHRVGEGELRSPEPVAGGSEPFQGSEHNRPAHR